jgi:hypothetical protein
VTVKKNKRLAFLASDKKNILTEAIVRVMFSAFVSGASAGAAISGTLP